MSKIFESYINDKFLLNEEENVSSDKNKKFNKNIINGTYSNIKGKLSNLEMKLKSSLSSVESDISKHEQSAPADYENALDYSTITSMLNSYKGAVNVSLKNVQNSIENLDKIKNGK